MDDDTYRQMLWTVARVESSKDLDEAGRRRVLEHLRANGFKGKQPTSKHPGRPHNIDAQPQLKKVEALLADAGRPWVYADTLAKRMFHVDRVAFCNPDQLQRLIAALSYDQKRRAKRSNV
jgi:phage gp16-like protein